VTSTSVLFPLSPPLSPPVSVSSVGAGGAILAARRRSVVTASVRASSATSSAHRGRARGVRAGAASSVARAEGSAKAWTASNRAMSTSVRWVGVCGAGDLQRPAEQVEALPLGHDTGEARPFLHPARHLRVSRPQRRLLGGLRRQQNVVGGRGRGRGRGVAPPRHGQRQTLRRQRHRRVGVLLTRKRHTTRTLVITPP
jgi:hypothetical protein